MKYKIVPVEPTEEMQNELVDAVTDGILINDDTHRTARHAYRNALERAPNATQDFELVERIALYLCRSFFPQDIFASITKKDQDIVHNSYIQYAKDLLKHIEGKE